MPLLKLSQMISPLGTHGYVVSIYGPMRIAFLLMYNLNIYSNPLIQGLLHRVGITKRAFDLDSRGIYPLFLLSISKSPQNLRTQYNEGNTEEENPC